MSVDKVIEKLKFETQDEKDFLLNCLKTSKVNIKFEKVDKTIREMKCTLLPDLLPKILEHILESQEVVDAKPKKESETAFRVWDLDKSAWRSIKWDSIIFPIRVEESSILND